MNFICISSCVLLNDQDFLLTSMIFQLSEFTVFTLGVFLFFCFGFSHYVLSVLLAVLSLLIVFKHVLLTHEVIDNSECVVLGILSWVSSSLCNL